MFRYRNIISDQFHARQLKKLCDEILENKHDFFELTEEEAKKKAQLDYKLLRCENQIDDMRHFPHGVRYEQIFIETYATEIISDEDILYFNLNPREVRGLWNFRNIGEYYRIRNINIKFSSNSARNFQPITCAYGGPLTKMPESDIDILNFTEYKRAYKGENSTLDIDYPCYGICHNIINGEKIIKQYDPRICSDLLTFKSGFFSENEAKEKGCYDDIDFGTIFFMVLTNGQSNGTTTDNDEDTTVDPNQPPNGSSRPTGSCHIKRKQLKVFDDKQINKRNKRATEPEGEGEGEEEEEEGEEKEKDVQSVVLTITYNVDIYSTYNYYQASLPEDEVPIYGMKSHGKSMKKFIKS